MRTGFLAMLMLAGAAQAEGIIQCRGADGKIIFSDRPCANGQAAQPVELSKPAATYSSRETQMRVERSAEAYGQMRETARREAEQRERVAKKETPFIDPVACGNAQRMLGEWSGVSRVHSVDVLGRERVHEVIDSKQRERYDEVVRACGKAPSDLKERAYFGR